MGEQHKRSKLPEEHRRLILDIAAEMAIEDSFSSLSFDVIARKSKLTKGGVLHHFANKQALMEGLFMQTLLEFEHMMLNIKASISDGSIGANYLETIVELTKDSGYRKLMKVLIKGTITSDRFRDIWIDWFENHMRNTKMELKSPKTLMQVLLADGIWYAQVLGYYNLSDSDLTDIMKEFKKL